MTPANITARLIGTLLGLALLASLGWLAKDRFAQKARADAAQRCDSAAAKPEAALSDCLPMVASRLREERQAKVCESALLPRLRPESRFLAAQACSAGVKRLIAGADAAAHDRDDLAARLATAQADTTRAVERAETRASRLQRRNDNALRTIGSAPRDAGGRIACDADCLRRLAE